MKDKGIGSHTEAGNYICNTTTIIIYYFVMLPGRRLTGVMQSMKLTIDVSLNCHVPADLCTPNMLIQFEIRVVRLNDYCHPPSLVVV